jgi:hypothetical protein
MLITRGPAVREGVVEGAVRIVIYLSLRGLIRYADSGSFFRF